MPDRIRINRQSNVLEIQSYGIVTSDDIAASFAKMIEIYNETGFFKVLVDTTMQEQMPSAFPIYKLFARFPKQFRIALHIRSNQATAKDLRFVETIAGNRGYDIRIFTSKHLAKQWLNAGRKKQLPS